ncbi:MAG: 50S ribosomal protein L21 [Chloroflexota bacterium]
MYAVIESGNKQYRVEFGTEIQVDRLDVQPGDSITLDRVLLVADGEDTAIGRPVVEGATVSAEVLRQERGDKIVVFKYKPKARTRVKKGFRAELTTLRISDIAFGGRSAAKDAKESEASKAKVTKAAGKAAAAKAKADVELAAKLAAADQADTADAPAAEPESAKPKASKTESAAKPKASKSDPADKSETTRKKSSAKAASATKATVEADAEPEAPAAAETADETDDTKKDG